jgi:hypothetical protein
VQIPPESPCICVDLKGQVVRAKIGNILLMFMSTG